LVAHGRELAGREPGRFDAEVAKGRGSDVAVLCTTSGTTSAPKLAMLQFGPFLAHLTSYLEADPRAPEDEYVCLLPLAWIMEQVYVVGMPLLSRIRVNFPESAETSMADMREIGPTHLLLAPRVWEQLAADMRARIMDANPLTRRLFAWGVREGVRALEQGRRSRLAEVLLFGTLRDRLGMSRVKSAATGGAALGPDTFKFFLAMGVPLRQLYGQTEASGAYTLQDGRDIDLDSSGLPFGDTELRIDDPDENGVGEIAVRHPGLFAGYFGNEEAARETVAADGWLLTGDAGYLDEKGAMFGALVGTSTTTAYVESAAGIEEGGRTGLTATTVGGLFGLSMFLWPLASAVPGAATAPALILVGALMIEGVRHVAWDDISEALPAFLTIILMPLTFSIANGVSFGVISYCLIAVLSGRFRKVSPILYVVALLLLARYIFLDSAG